MFLNDSLSHKIYTERAYLSDFFDGIKLGFYPLFERAALQILIGGLGTV
jgi:hypothetical protein